jgi:hypothetical protein
MGDQTKSNAGEAAGQAVHPTRQSGWAIAITLLGISAVLFAPGLTENAPVKAATDCVSSAPASAAYSVTVCFSSPADGSSQTGDTTISATAAVSGTNPGVQRMVFYLDGTYLLTDYSNPYQFTLQTARWVDGSHSLAVETDMRDDFVTNQASIQVDFVNGVSTPPSNQNSFTPTGGTSPGSGRPLVVAAVGDGASGEANETSVTNLIASWNPNLFLYLGDVYEKGSVTEFTNWYGSSNQLYGQFRSITDPTVGNHEYTNKQAPGYFDYWDNVPNYYSFDAGGWHFISLNANTQFNQSTPGTAQYQWLVQDLAADHAGCTLAYWHEPLFNIGQEPPATYVQSMWTLLAQSGVDIVLNGHDHDYQRWLPMDGSGQLASPGMTEFVVGTGGHGIQTLVQADSRVARSFDSTTSPAPYGALRLTLSSTNAAFAFINTRGTVLDSGTIACQNAGSVTPTPTPTATSIPPTRTPTRTPLPATPTPTNTPLPPSATPTALPTLRGGQTVTLHLPLIQNGSLP